MNRTAVVDEKGKMSRDHQCRGFEFFLIYLTFIYLLVVTLILKEATRVIHFKALVSKLYFVNFF